METNTGKQNHSGKVIPTHTEANMKKTESQGGKAVLPVHNVGFLKKKEVPWGPNHPKSWRCWEASTFKNNVQL